MNSILFLSDGPYEIAQYRSPHPQILAMMMFVYLAKIAQVLEKPGGLWRTCIVACIQTSVACPYPTDASHPPQAGHPGSGLEGLEPKQPSREFHLLVIPEQALQLE